MIYIKTWEIIKMLSENPKLKFKCADEYVISVKENGLLLLTSGIEDVEFSGNIRLVKSKYYEADEWELVREPVDFITAINSGKRVRSELWKSGDFVNTNIPKDSWHTVTTDEINGKWYIE